MGKLDSSNTVLSGVLNRFSILALGIVPWFAALTCIELIVVLLPKSWTLRYATSGHAEPFSRSVIGLALLIAALQGFAVTDALMQQPKLVLSPGPDFQFPVVAALVAGLACIIGLARVIERQGVGNGFWIMLAASMVVQLSAHASLMLMMLREGIASSAATVVVIASTVAICAMLIGILGARRRSNRTSIEIFIWPLVLAALASGLIVDVTALILPAGTDDKLDALAKMLTNEPAGFVISGVIASVLAARYASREKEWQFFLPAVALIGAVQLQSIIAESLQVQLPLAGASLVIVTAVGYVVVTRVREAMQGP